MKGRTKHAELHRPGDCKAMTEAIDWLEKHGIEVYRATEHCLHLPDGAINIYPARGTIQVRNDKALKEKGLAALANYLDVPFENTRGETLTTGAKIFDELRVERR